MTVSRRIIKCCHCKRYCGISNKLGIQENYFNAKILSYFSFSFVGAMLWNSLTFWWGCVLVITLGTINFHFLLQNCTHYCNVCGCSRGVSKGLISIFTVKYRLKRIIIVITMQTQRAIIWKHVTYTFKDPFSEWVSTIFCIITCCYLDFYFICFNGLHDW